MKIALFNCNWRSVPPKKSGGIEKIISHLIDGFLEEGHEVTLFSTGDSTKKNGLNIVSVLDEEIESRSISDEDKNFLNDKASVELGKRLIEMQDQFDIIHNHCINAALPILPFIKTPLVNTLHEFFTFESIDRLEKYKDLNYVSISYSQRKPFPELHYVDNIYHGIDVSEYPVPVKSDDYLVFVGRISQQKNPHLAIQAAKRMKKKIYIIGNYKDESVESEYYNKVFLPCLKENKEYVEWLGELKTDEVMNIMNKAYASLLPVTVRESFGLAAVESMACGCPSIAFDRGAYNETIKHGKTGFIVEDVEEMVAAIKRIELIDRNYCRKYVQEHFNVRNMVKNYLNLYKKIIKDSHPHSSIFPKRLFIRTT